MEKFITQEILLQYQEHLYDEEKSLATIQKYMRDLQKLLDYAAGREITKRLMIQYKEDLRDSNKYRTSSINSFLVAANRLFEYLHWYEVRVKIFRVQKEVFEPENKNLTKEEYVKLVKTAEKLGKRRLAMIIQTICATGIRVSELSSITIESVKKGVADIYCKGKQRKVLITPNLQKKLMWYIRENNIDTGIVFQTSGGKAVNRSNIWREMKSLCVEAGVEKEKVYPHNLRHLFAKIFYKVEKDIAKLADVLGHSSIETTRIYIRTTSFEHQKQLELMGLVVGT